VVEMNIEYWIKLYQSLRYSINFSQADELREMLRRMGYEIRIKDKNGTVQIKEIDIK